MSDKKVPSPGEKRPRRTLTYEDWANKFAESNHKHVWRGYLNTMKIDHQKTIDD